MRGQTVGRKIAAVFAVGAVSWAAAVASFPQTADAAEPGAGSATAVTSAVYMVAPRVSYSIGDASALLQGFFKQAADQQAHGDQDGVIATMQQALHVDAKNCDVYATLADAQAAKGDFAAAIQNYTIAIGDGADQNWSSSRMADGDLQLRFALLLLRAGSYELAAQRYKEGYDSLEVADKKALPGSFKVKDLKDDKDNARARLRTACRSLLGLKYGTDGHATEATAVLQAALHDDEADAAPAALFLANVQFAAGNRSEAVSLWQKAVSLGDGDVKKLAEASLRKAQ